MKIYLGQSGYNGYNGYLLFLPFFDMFEDEKNLDAIIIRCADFGSLRASRLAVRSGRPEPIFFGNLEKMSLIIIFHLNKIRALVE